MRFSEERYLRWRAGSIVGLTTGFLLLLAPGQLSGQATAQASVAVNQTAQSVTDSVMVSLSDLYDHLSNHPLMEAARARSRAASSRVAGAGRPMDPELQLGFMNYTLPGFAPMDPVGMVQLQVMQVVPMGHKLSLARRSAEAGARVMAVGIDQANWDLRLQLATAWYELAAVDLTLINTAESLRLLDDMSRSLESRYQAGSARQVEVLRLRSERSRVSEDTLRLQASRQALLSRINTLLQRPVDTAIRPTLGPFPANLPGAAWLDSLAFASQPAIRTAEEQVRAAEADSRLAARNLTPDLEIGISYGFRRGSDLDGHPMNEGMWSLMVGSSLPIFKRSRQLQEREEARAMQETARAQLSASQLTTGGQIREILADLERVRRLMTLYQDEIIPQAEAVLQSAMITYRSGTGEFEDLIEGLLALSQFQKELITLRVDEGRDWTRLEYLTGYPLLNEPSSMSGGQQ